MNYRLNIVSVKHISLGDGSPVIDVEFQYLDEAGTVLETHRRNFPEGITQEEIQEELQKSINTYSKDAYSALQAERNAENEELLAEEEERISQLAENLEGATLEAEATNEDE